MPAPLRLGISACLLGAEVRWDGGHKRDGFLAEASGPEIEWVSVCPEVELGMGVPREAVHLRRREGALRLQGVQSGRDWTEAMEAFAERRARELGSLELDGYVLKSKSPSCGLERLPIHDAGGSRALGEEGTGFFAAALRRWLPELPVVEERQLEEAFLREHFCVRALAHRRLRAFFSAPWSAGDLVAFHAAEKLQLLAHDEIALRELGRLVAGFEEAQREDLAARYRALHRQAHREPPSRGRHANALEHGAGMLRGALEPRDLRELHGAIAAYRTGLESRRVPLALLAQHARRAGSAWLRSQSYLEPLPPQWSH